MRVKKKIFVWALLLIPIVVSMFAVNIGSSATQDSITAIEPRTIFDADLIPGTQFTIDITVDWVEKLWGHQVTVSFNPEVLQGVSVELGPFLGSKGGTVWTKFRGWNNTIGEMYLWGAWLDPIKRLPTGGGVLCSITFEVVGYGSSCLTLGVETGLADEIGNWITHKLEDPELFWDGYFLNALGPELWIREKHGTHGGGAFTEWMVNLLGEEQIIYSKVAQSGEMAALVKVEFTVHYIEIDDYETYESNEVEIPAVYFDPDTGKKVFPLVTVATDPFVPEGYGHYVVTAKLLFKVGCVDDWIVYETVEDTLGGLGTGRDIATKFKVQEEVK